MICSISIKPLRAILYAPLASASLGNLSEQVRLSKNSPFSFATGEKTQVVARYITNAQGAQEAVMKEVDVLYGVPFDFTGLVLFVLMLAGILNIFGAVSMSNKKNLGSVITCTITSSIIVIAGALYLYALFTFMGGVNSGAISMKNEFQLDGNWIVSIASIVISMLTSIAGVILGFINYDRTYEKVDR